MSREAALTITVPEAGKRYFNLSRGASYAAAERGEIPTIRVGRLLRVPIRAMENKLDAAEYSTGSIITNHFIHRKPQVRSRALEKPPSD